MTRTLILLIDFGELSVSTCQLHLNSLLCNGMESHETCSNKPRCITFMRTFLHNSSENVLNYNKMKKYIFQLYHSTSISIALHAMHFYFFQCSFTVIGRQGIFISKAHLVAASDQSTVYSKNIRQSNRKN